ncbi:uncharacterized protein LOC113211984 [Frankliniella occidentalis]|uniref:Uncharacterized protein LOC113211984 n=1 Tax=Frankliniella occidentalis TaxID=133901 RepID=A0A6J1SZH4_FRAOC|nr:uncharacterized protein LOC113211984 [Frankliniella occidentalis]
MPDLPSAERLQQEAAKLLTEVKASHKISQRAIDHFVKGVDTLYDILLDVLKEFMVEKLSNRDGYLTIADVTTTLEQLKGQCIFEGVQTKAKLDRYNAYMESKKKRESQP